MSPQYLYVKKLLKIVSKTSKQTDRLSVVDIALLMAFSSSSWYLVVDGIFMLAWLSIKWFSSRNRSCNFYPAMSIWEYESGKKRVSHSNVRVKFLLTKLWFQSPNEKSNVLDCGGMIYEIYEIYDLWDFNKVCRDRGSIYAFVFDRSKTLYSVEYIHVIMRVVNALRRKNIP